MQLPHIRAVYHPSGIGFFDLFSKTDSIPCAIRLSVGKGVGGYGCPIFLRVTQIGTAF